MTINLLDWIRRLVSKDFPAFGNYNLNIITKFAKRKKRFTPVSSAEITVDLWAYHLLLKILICLYDGRNHLLDLINSFLYTYILFVR